MHTSCVQIFGLFISAALCCSGVLSSALKYSTHTGVLLNSSQGIYFTRSYFKYISSLKMFFLADLIVFQCVWDHCHVEKGRT